MKTPSQIFQAVCAATDTEAAIAALSWEERHALYGYVLKSYCENLPSGMIYGMLAVDAAKRLYEGRGQDVPATLKKGKS